MAINERVITDGAQADSLLSVLRPRLRARCERIVNMLVQAHIDDALTETKMRSGIAAIAELRALERDLTSASEKGHSALSREIGRPGRE